MKPFQSINSIRYASIALISALSCLALNIASFSCFCYRRRKSSITTPSKNSKKVESNLLFVTVIIFIFQMLSAVFQLFINKLISNQEWDALSEAILYVPWIVDISCLSSPWILMFMSTNVRKSFFRSIKKKRSCSTSQTATHLLLLQSRNSVR